MPVVPLRKPKARAAPPPDPEFALMAAAQMHSEGRLVSPSSAAIDSTQTTGALSG